MLLEAAHEVCEHAANPELCQKVVSGDVFVERSGNATEEAKEENDMQDLSVCLME